MKSNKMYFWLKQLLNSSYAPYSGFGVSCIISADNGFYPGVNVENASYGATLCAERNAIGAFISNGGRQINAIYILSVSDQFCTPCGMCRQVLMEFCHVNIPVYIFNIYGEYVSLTLQELLPYSFSNRILL